MGKVRTKILGLEEIENKEREEAKKRSQEKKSTKNKSEEVVEETKKVESVKKILIKRGVKKRGKKHIEAMKGVHKDKKYSFEEAIKIIKKIRYANFDESIEIHMNLVEKGMRGEVELPHPTGKPIRALVVDEKVLASIEAGNLDFDVLVAHPSMMAKLVKYAKILGPKGLMPNPKAGTVSLEPEKVVEKLMKGSIHWKAESKFPLLHQMVAKVSQEDKAIVENCKAFFNSVGKVNIKACFVKSSMSPAVEIDTEAF